MKLTFSSSKVSKAVGSALWQFVLEGVVGDSPSRVSAGAGTCLQRPLTEVAVTVGFASNSRTGEAGTKIPENNGKIGQISTQNFFKKSSKIQPLRMKPFVMSFETLFGPKSQFGNFPVTQILREIKFGNFKVSKIDFT